ncbi:hypothetical protein HDU91_004452, partial [Kappamyces sp. JEL0680]
MLSKLHKEHAGDKSLDRSISCYSQPLPQTRNPDAIVPKSKSNRHKLLTEIKLKRELDSVAAGGTLPIMNQLQHKLIKT